MLRLWLRAVNPQCFASAHLRTLTRRRIRVAQKKLPEGIAAFRKGIEVSRATGAGIRVVQPHALSPSKPKGCIWAHRQLRRLQVEGCCRDVVEAVEARAQVYSNNTPWGFRGQSIILPRAVMRKVIPARDTLERDQKKITPIEHISSGDLQERHRSISTRMAFMSYQRRSK